MSDRGLIDEGGYTSFSLRVPDADNLNLVFDLKGVRIDYSGSAQVGSDYTFQYSAGAGGISGRVFALYDDLVEGIERGAITASGTLVLIQPGETGLWWENVLGDRIEGSLYERPVSAGLTFSINSRPVGTLDPVVHVGAGSGGVVRNLLESFADGPDETLRIRNAGPFDLGHSAGTIDADGSLRLTRVDPSAPPSFDLSIVVEDDRGAWTRATQQVQIAHLTLENPRDTIILREGQVAPAFRFALSAPVDEPVTVTAQIAPAGFGADLEVDVGEIRAGETTASLFLLAASRDTVLEAVESGRVTLTARAGGRDVPINGAASHRFDLEVWDELRSPVTPPAAQQGYNTAALMNQALFDHIGIALAADIGADHAALASRYASRVGLALSISIDANAVYAAYDTRMRAAERLTDRGEQIEAFYDARRLLFVETGNAAAKTIVGSASAAFGGGAMAWLLGAGAVALWPALAGVAVGWGAVLLYESYEEDIKSRLLDDFSNVLPRSSYRRYYEEADRKRLENPDLSLRFGAEGGEPVALTEAAEAVLLAGQGGRIAGSPAALDGDVVFGLGLGGSILVEGAGFDAGALRVTRGSAVLGIDLDGDGTDDTVLTLEGDFDGIDFTVAAEDAGTRISAVAAIPPPVVLTGGAGPDTLDGAAGNDTLAGLGGDDLLRGDAGDDVLNGGDGADTLNAGAGDDRIFGGLGPDDRRDTIFAGAGNDTVHAGAGNDEVHGGDGDDLVFGEVGADNLIGNAGRDTLSGGSLGDALSGGPGDDFLNGGFGFDRINGGPGADTFFHSGIRDHGSDWIQDYRFAEGDVLATGLAGLARADIVVNRAVTPGAGAASVAELFVGHAPTGLTLFALVDGAAEAGLWMLIGGQPVDLLA
jgi:hypothetical protein